MPLIAAVVIAGVLADAVPEKKPAPAATPATDAASVSKWNGFTKRSFAVDGHAAFVVVPQIAAPGKPWVWRTSFPDFHAEVDRELARNGWHIGFVDCVDMLGSDSALDLMDKFYEKVRQERGLAAKPAIEAVSRGGLHAYRYAARHPERIACIYADTPVMDLKSWPMKATNGSKQLEDAMKFYGFKSGQELKEYKGNPLDLLPVLAKAKIPMRNVISLDDKVVPAEDNTLEARRRLRNLGWDMDVVSVKNGDPAAGGHHFPLPEVSQSSRFIMKRSSVLPNGAEYFHLRDGLANCKAKFETAKTGRVAFLGGSITHNGGWRDELMRYFQQRFPGTRFEFIPAGIGSLGSVPHAFRLERDVLARGPVDLIFVEAAVNDHNYDGSPDAAALALRGMEGVVRHLRMANPMTDIVEMHFAHNIHIPEYNEGRVPYTVAAHEKVAEYYGCPSLNLSREVAERIAAGEFTWAGDFRDLHPSPYGQRVYANSMTCMLDSAFAAETETKAHLLPDKPLDERSYARGRYGKVSDARIVKGFKLEQNWNPHDGVGTREGFVNVPALVGSQPGDEFEFDFEGTACGLFVAAGPKSGTIEYSIDGAASGKANTYTQWSGGLYLPWAVVLSDSLKPGKHTVKVRIEPNNDRTKLVVIHLLLN